MFERKSRKEIREEEAERLNMQGCSILSNCVLVEVSVIGPKREDQPHVPRVNNADKFLEL